MPERCRRVKYFDWFSLAICIVKYSFIDKKNEEKHNKFNNSNIVKQRTLSTNNLAVHYRKTRDFVV